MRQTNKQKIPCFQILITYERLSTLEHENLMNIYKWHVAKFRHHVECICAKRMKLPHHGTEVRFLMDYIPIKMCYEPRFKGISHRLSSKENVQDQKKRTNQVLQRERLEGNLRDVRVLLAWMLTLGLQEFPILENKPSDFLTFEEWMIQRSLVEKVLSNSFILLNVHLLIFSLDQ